MKSTLWIIPVLVFAGCRTTEKILNDYEKDLLSGNYAHAAIEVGEKAAEEDKSELFWRLQLAGAQYLQDDKDAAIATFDRAEDIFHAVDSRSGVSKGTTGTWAMLTNEKAFPYEGGGEDRIFTCFYKAVDYMTSGNIAAARTELNRAAQHQANWIDERQAAIAEAREKFEKDAKEYAEKEKSDTDAAQKASDAAEGNDEFNEMIREKTGYDAEQSGRLESLVLGAYMNAYVQHVCGVFRWLQGDGGREYIRTAKDVKPDNSLIAADFESVDTKKPKNQVWIYVEDGLCPVREEWRLDLPIALIPYANKYVLYAGMALPLLKERAAACSNYEVLSGDVMTSMVEIEDIDHLLRTEYDVYFRACLAREISRTVIKVGVQAGCGIAAETTNNSHVKLGFRIAQGASAAWALATTGADIRTWTALPKKVYAIRVKRPADGKLTLRGNGLPIAEIELPKGNSMVFVRKVSPSAPAVVKTAVFK